MNFIDHTGHIFSIQHYPSYPIGYEYDECDYTFWMSDEYSSQLSIDCLYIKPIRLLLNGDVSSIDISIKNSNIFKLLSSKTVQNLIEKNENIFDYIELNYATDDAINYYKEINQDVSDINDFTSTLTLDDLLILDVSGDNYCYINENNEIIKIQNESDIYCDDLSVKHINVNGVEYEVIKKCDEFQFVPFYVVGLTSDFGTWSTNVLIHVKYNDLTESYCPITVGGTFMNEFEELTINAKNTGISLPKDICRSLYNFSFWNETPNLSLWNQKIKEILLNYMKLRGERGNFQSALEALKWFGYGNKVNISSLVQTDNTFVEQYIQDKFDLQYDVINEFQYFRNSTLLSLSIPAITEDNIINEFEFNNDFWGEGKPKLKNLFEETTVVHYDEGDIDFIKPYYNWSFNELGLKLCALKYYYQKYFLPIHLYIHRASLTTQCFAGDVKMLNSAKTWITEGSIYVPDNSTHVEFPKQHTLWLYEQNRLVDENWIEDNNFQEIIKDYLNDSEEIFYNITDNCFSLTIKFINDKWESENDEQMFYCNMSTFQNENLIKHSIFSICSNEKEYLINFIICPKLLNKNFDNNFWFDKKYKIVLLCNDAWYEYEFDIDIPELDIEIGKLKYEYDDKVCKQFSGFDGNKPNFNVSMYLPEIVTINNIDFVNDLCEAIENEHISKLDPSFFDDVITSNQVYYYFYDDEGKKTLLSSGDKTLVKENGKYILKESRYSDPKIIDRLVYSSTYKNIESLVDLYSVKTNIPTNENFLNKVYIFSLLDKDKNDKVKYDNYYEAIHCTNVITNWKDNHYFIKFENISYELINSIDKILEKINDNDYIKENWEDKYYFYKDDSGNYIQLSNINEIESGITYYTYNNDIYYINNGNSYKAIHCSNVITNWKDNYYFTNVSYKLINSINDILQSKDNDYIKENWEDKYYFYKDDSGNYIQLSNINEIESGITYYTCDNDIYYINNCGLNNIESPLKLEFGEYRFNDNDSELIRDLYLNIFDENGNWTKDLSYWDYDNNSWKESSIEKKFFDIYLMHDFDYWYIIMISKETIGFNNNLDFVKDLYLSGKFIFKRERSEDKFLINRMNYENMNGVYHFNPKDMIVSKLNNMNTIPFKLKIGSRWNFTPIGISKDHTNTFESNTNIGLMSIKNTDVQHSNGYYEVQVNYSIDNFVNHSQNRTTKILISNEF